MRWGRYYWPNNPFNPDPSKEVRWGDQSWEEMMVAVIDVAIDPKLNPLDLYRPQRRVVQAVPPAI